MTTDKRGVSALLLQRQLGLSCYETAWMMLHKLRRAMVNAVREPLHGEVEVDDTWVGGEQAGLRGSRQLKNRRAALVLVAVEKRGQISGRARMNVIPAATGTIAIWYTTVTLKTENGKLGLEAKAEPYGVDGEDELKLRALGHDQIFWEYARAQTDRAKLWRKQVEGTQVPVDRKLEETVTRLVELTINNDPEGVGGNVDRVRLEIGKGIQWQQRKPGC